MRKYTWHMKIVIETTSLPSNFSIVLTIKIILLIAQQDDAKITLSSIELLESLPTPKV